jgi:hypothetical protein
VILKTYRQLNRPSQEQLAIILGYDKTYLSMIETRRRIIGDVTTPPHRPLSMHGNELRKAGRTGAAIERLRRSIAMCTDPAARTSALALLARAAGEAGNADLFDSTMTSYRTHQCYL